MKILKLPKEKLDLFASVVQQFGELHAPVEQDGKYVFKRLTRWSDARLEYDRTILPPKKYFLPPRETLFRYSPGEGFVPNTDGLDQRIILFGVHACDVYALNILDRVFAGKYKDPYYQARRKNIAIIGIDCTPDKQCFCRSMRADFVDHGFDLFFYDTGDYYQALVGTALGDDMVLATGSLFETVDAADIDDYKRRSRNKRRAFQLEVEIRDLPEIFEMEYQSEIWNELGQKVPLLRKLQHGLPHLLLLRRDGRRGAGLARRQTRALVGFLPVRQPRAGGQRREFPRAALQPHQVPLLSQAARLRGGIRPAELRGLRPVRQRLPGAHRRGGSDRPLAEGGRCC